MRLFAAIFLLTATLAVAGCLSTQLKATSNRPVETSMDVFVQASVLRHMTGSCCMFPFNAPHEMEAASPTLTSVFQSRISQSGPFGQIRLVAKRVASDTEALWYARKMGCSLAMLPSLIYMMDGTGGMPTKLVVRLRILDAATGQVLWDIKQSAYSEPGPDVDLTWNTVVGAPAQRCLALADCLAQRFAGYLTQLLVQERQAEAEIQR
jgi:hypothetical protein